MTDKDHVRKANIPRLMMKWRIYQTLKSYIESDENTVELEHPLYSIIQRIYDSAGQLEHSLEKQLKNYSKSYLDSNHNSKKTFYRSLLGVSVLSLFTFNEGFSQTIEKENISLEINNIETKISENNIAQQEITKGLVFDELGPLAGASVTLKNTNLSTSTDFDGNFVFNKKLNIGDVIIISYIGFKTKEYTIKDLKKIEIAMDLYSGELIMMGEVDVKKVFKSKKTFFQRIKDVF